MNSFTHGLASVRSGDAWLVAGTALPDWLRVVARRLRASPDRARAALNADDPRLRSLARGVIIHFEDDRRFHGSPAFARAVEGIAARLRPPALDVPGLRPSFVAHLLVEMLLDSELARRDPAARDAYYGLLESLDPDAIEAVAQPLATAPFRGLAPLVRSFVAARLVDDYADDGRLVFRLDQVMRRMRQPPLAGRLDAVLAASRAAVVAATDALVAAAHAASGETDPASAL